MPKIDDFARTLFQAPNAAGRLPKPALRRAVEAAPLPTLGPRPVATPLAELLQHADVFEDEDGNGCGNGDGLWLAGLWLLAGDLDRSHALSQSVNSPEGSLWHGIMHRREGDFENAKYWLRRAGTHSIYRTIARASGRPWFDPGDFVDDCRDACRRDDHANKELCVIQWLEWQALMLASDSA